LHVALDELDLLHRSSSQIYTSQCGNDNHKVNTQQYKNIWGR
jgi:hypothetical protein